MGKALSTVGLLRELVDLSRRSAIPAVMPYQATATVARVFRYQATGSTTTPISMGDILDQWFVATSTTTGVRIASALKIRKIEMWQPNSTTSFSTTPCAISWDMAANAGGVGAPSTVVSASALGSSGVAHIVSRPPAGCLGAMWLSGPTDVTQLLSLTYATGCIVDIHVTLHMPEGAVGSGDAPVAENGAIVGATLGSFYVRGFPLGSATLVPVTSASV